MSRVLEPKNAVEGKHSFIILILLHTYVWQVRVSGTVPEGLWPTTGAQIVEIMSK